MISIITVVRNGAVHLEQTIRSVQSQHGCEYEHLVVDGGSTDGTLDIIRRHSKNLAWWTSEPDGGIADAMNKGAARSMGQWLLFLHADDALLSPTSLAEVSSQLDTAADIVACSLQYGDRTTRLRTPRPPNFWLNFKTGLLHQATLIRRELLGTIGPFDTTYKIALDYEFFLRAYRRRVPVKLCPAICLSIMGDGGVSSRQDWPSVKARLREERRIHRQHCNSLPLQSLYAIYWALYSPYRCIIASTSARLHRR